MTVLNTRVTIEGWTGRGGKSEDERTARRLPSFTREPAVTFGE